MTRMIKHLTQLAVALAIIASVAVAPNTAMAAESYYLQRNLVTNFRDKYRTRLEPWSEDAPKRPRLERLGPGLAPGRGGRALVDREHPIRGPS